MMRRTTDDELRREIWNRDGGTCQACGATLDDVFDPAEGILDAIFVLDKIPVYRWARPCWKCKEPADVATYHLSARREYTLGDIEKLDYILLARYPFMRKHYSRPLECEVVANTCRRCGAQQSNFYVRDEFAGMAASGADLSALVDAEIPNPLQLSDFPECEDRPPTAAHVHHRDGNWQNNATDNLVLLCRACHLKVHGR